MKTRDERKGRATTTRELEKEGRAGRGGVGGTNSTQRVAGFEKAGGKRVSRCNKGFDPVEFGPRNARYGSTEREEGRKPKVSSTLFARLLLSILPLAWSFRLTTKNAK